MSQLRRRVCQRILAQAEQGVVSTCLSVPSLPTTGGSDGGVLRLARSASLPPDTSSVTPLSKWTRTEVEGVEMRAVLESDGAVHKHLRVCVDTLDWGAYCTSVRHCLAHMDRIVASFSDNNNAMVADHVFDELADFNFDVFLHMRVLESVARIKFQRSHRHRNSLLLMPYVQAVGSVRASFGGAGARFG